MEEGPSISAVFTQYRPRASFTRRVVGGLVNTILISGALSASSSMSCALSVTRNLELAIPATSAYAVSLSNVGHGDIVGAIPATSVLSIGLTVARPIAGEIAAVSGVSAPLSVTRNLVLEIAATSTVSASVSIEGQNAISATIAATSSVSAALSVTKNIEAAIAAVSTVSATLDNYTGAPQLVLRTASTKNVGGDSNTPAVWDGGVLKAFISEGAGGIGSGEYGGVKRYIPFAAGIEGTAGTPVTVTSDRSYLDDDTPQTNGYWLEGVISYGGSLYGCGHAEKWVASGTKIHVFVGFLKSTNGGVTWTDIGGGPIIDTPSGSDKSGGVDMGYYFIGGNGDCSMMIDGSYLYFIWSQYGATAANQGIAMGRLPLANIDAPQGFVQKWYNGSWSEAGVGGQTTPLIPNEGDCYGDFDDRDYYWGPSIHYNQHLSKWIAIFTRANSTSFKQSGAGQNNYWSYTNSLSNPSWSTPQAFSYPGGYAGDWYPVNNGLEDGVGTDKLSGQQARIFANGVSNYYAWWYRADEKPIDATIAATSSVSAALTVTGGNDIVMAIPATATVSATISKTANLELTIPVTSTVSATLSVGGNNPITGTIAAASTVSADLSVTKNITATIVAAGTVSATVSVSSGETVLMEDNLTGSAGSMGSRTPDTTNTLSNNWAIIQGDVSVNGSGVASGNGSSSQVGFNAESGNGYAFSARMLVPSGQYGAVNVNGPGVYQTSVEVGLYEGNLYVYVNESNNYAEAANLGAVAPHGSYFVLKVEVSSTQWKVYVDGSLVGTVSRSTYSQFDSNTYAGVLSENSGVLWDWFKLTAL